MLVNQEIAPFNAPAQAQTQLSPTLATWYARVQIVLMATFVAVSASASADGIDLGPVKTLICSLADQLKAPALLGAAGFVIVLVFGWNKLMGESNAFQGLKNGVIGGLIILSAGTIAQALFKGSC